MSEISINQTSQVFRTINAENSIRYPSSSSATEESGDTDDTESYVIDKATHSDNISLHYDLDLSSPPESLFSENTDTKEFCDVILEKNLGEEPPDLFEKEPELKEKQPAIDSNEDDDVWFFNSLLPYVKKLEPEKKLLFRMQVQRQLYSLSFSQNRTNELFAQIPFPLPPPPPSFPPTAELPVCQTDLSQIQRYILQQTVATASPFNSLNPH